MTPDDLTRAIPQADDRTRSLVGSDDTFARPDPPAADTPSGVHVVPDSLDPSATVLRPADASPDPSAPTFEHYQLLGELGRGGMGVVYKALDTQLKRDVAIKVLAARMVGNPSAERRFKEEALVTGQLTHTAIPPVHQLGTLPDGRQFLVMKLIKGRTLGERLKGRPDPSANLTDHLGVLEQVSLGVGYAHSRGVIHRDLKPANIMVGAFGEVLVMDWGLAKEVRAQGSREDTAFTLGGEPPAAEGEPPDTVLRDVREAGEEYTRAGTVLGTPSYMSPEQAAGDPDAVDAHTDVFSLGAILCVILTGQPPYTGKTMQEVILKAAGWETADAFRRLGMCRVDTAVIELCKRCLAREPGQRPANGEAVAKELAEIRATAAERLKKADLAEMARLTKQGESKRRRRMQLTLAAAVACIVGLVGLAGWYVWDQKELTAKAVQDQLTKDAEVNDALRGKDEAAAAAEAKRQAELEKQAKEAEAKRAERERAITAAIKQVEATLGEIQPARSDIEMSVWWSTQGGMWDNTLDRARIGLTLAEQLLLDVPNSELAPRVKQLRVQLGLAKKQRQLVANLDVIASTFREKEQTSERNQALAARYRDAFQEAGYPDPDRPAEFIHLVGQHPVPAALVEAVFDWHTHADHWGQKALAALLDKLTEHKADGPLFVQASQHATFLDQWWAARKDTTPTGTKALLALAADPIGSRRTPWVAHRVFCDLWHRGEREVATRHMRDALVLYPSIRLLRVRFAHHLSELNTPAARAEAIAHITAAVALQPQSEDDYILLGRLEAEQSGNPADALRYLEWAKNLGVRGSIPIRLELADVYTRLNRPKDAEFIYQEINGIDPAVDIRFAAVRARWANGDREGALKELKGKLLPTVPKTVEGHLGLARVYRCLEQHADAEAAYQSAVTAAPKQLEPRIEFAQYLADQGHSTDDPRKVREAEKVLAAAATDFPDHYLPRWHQVWVYSQMGEKAKALAAGQEAAKLGKGSEDAAHVLGQAQLVAGKDADATATAEQFVKSYPYHWRGPTLMAEIAAAEGKPKEAIKHYQQAIALIRSSDDVLYRRETPYPLNPLETTLAPTRRTLAALWNSIGDQHALQSDSTNAVKAFAEAVQSEPNSARHHLNLGTHLGLLGDKKGLDHLRKAKELNPALKDSPPK